MALMTEFMSYRIQIFFGKLFFKKKLLTVVQYTTVNNQSKMCSAIVIIFCPVGKYYLSYNFIFYIHENEYNHAGTFYWTFEQSSMTQT